MQGIIFDIKHYAIHDGPGIRTTVFLKGCPLGCWWCHNPESRSKEISCFLKEEKVNGHVIEAFQTVGKNYSVGEVMEQLEKDVVLFEESGGGVTFSGGEPFAQYEFLLKLLKESKKREWHTCVDTTGYVDSKKLEKAAGYIDLFLYDLKQTDDEKHVKYTGISNKKILENLFMLDEMGKKIEIRYPLIPGINDDEADLLWLISLLRKLKNKPALSILPYHKIGSHKYKLHGIEYKMKGIEEPSKEHIEKIKNTIEEAGFMTSVGG